MFLHSIIIYSLVQITPNDCCNLAVTKQRVSVEALKSLFFLTFTLNDRQVSLKTGIRDNFHTFFSYVVASQFIKSSQLFLTISSDVTKKMIIYHIGCSHYIW
jgi:hypothetical protein